MKGKFFVDREILESDIWSKPAYYLKIWVWIIANANWKTIKKGGKTFRRGEFITNYEDIIGQNEWLVGWNKKQLTKDQVFNVLDFLRETDRIKTKKATRGLWIKVLNYDYFQLIPKSNGNPSEIPAKATQKAIENKHESNIESNRESKSRQTASQQGKRKKNERRMKEDIVSKADERKKFSFKDELNRLLKDKRRHIRVIGLYWQFKGFDFKNWEQFDASFKRELKPATKLVGWNDDKLLEVMEWLENNTTYGWKLETVLKYVSENLDEIGEKPDIPPYAQPFPKEYRQ